MDFCAFNVVIYDRRGKHWALTEWPREAVTRASERLQIGPDSIGWRGDDLVVTFDERCAPFGGPLRGRITLKPALRFAEPYPLDVAGRHHWCPIAPTARAEVELQEPALRFTGPGYHDSNIGDEPLEAAFHSWNWSRAPLAEGAAILYDVERRVGGPLELGRIFRNDGAIVELEAPERHALPNGSWGEPRATRTDADGEARVVRTLESSPFYARSLLRTALAGEQTFAMHEALSLDRFTRGWVQFLLPFKTRRRNRWPW